MIVVSNTSPIINLAAVGQLNLLHQLYGELIVPQAVYDEIVVAGEGLPGSAEVATSDWIHPQSAANRTAVTALQSELDPGEAEAIALAVELNADMLLLDERIARRIASRFGLPFVGILGVLLEAKAQGLVVDVKPIVDQLISQAGFWIDSRLYARVLQAAGE